MDIIKISCHWAVVSDYVFLALLVMVTLWVTGFLWLGVEQLLKGSFPRSSADARLALRVYAVLTLIMLVYVTWVLSRLCIWGT